MKNTSLRSFLIIQLNEYQYYVGMYSFDKLFSVCFSLKPNAIKEHMYISQVYHRVCISHYMKCFEIQVEGENTIVQWGFGKSVVVSRNGLLLPNNGRICTGTAIWYWFLPCRTKCRGSRMANKLMRSYCPVVRYMFTIK